MMSWLYAKINDLSRRNLRRVLVFRAHVDDRDIRPGGTKHYHWEIRGAPIRLELGPRDLDPIISVLLSLRTGGKESQLV